MKGSKLFFLSLFCVSFFLKAMDELETKDQIHKLASPDKEVGISLKAFNALKRCRTIKNLFADIKEEEGDESITTIPVNIDPTKVTEALPLLVLDDIFAIKKELGGKSNKELLEAIQTVNYLDCGSLLHLIRDEIVKRFTSEEFVNALNTDACSDWYQQLKQLPPELRVCEASCRLHKSVLIPQLLKALSYSYEESVVCQNKEDSTVRVAQYSPDGSKMLIGYEGTVEIRDIEGDKLLPKTTTLHPHKGPIYHAAPRYVDETDYIKAATFSPDGTRVATSASDGLVKIWNSQGERVCIMQTQQNPTKVHSIGYSPNSRLIAIGYADKTKICNLQNRYKILAGHKGPVFSVNFSPCSNLVVTGSADKTAKIWNLEGECETTLPHKGAVYSARFSPDGSKVLTGSADKTAKIWNLEGECETTLPHKGAVYTARFSPDGSWIITGTSKGEVKIWNLKGQCLATLSNWGLTSSPVRVASFSPDGSKVLTVARKQSRKGLFLTTAGIIKIWDLNDLKKKYANLESFFNNHITIEQLVFLLALNKTLEPKPFWQLKNKTFDYSQNCWQEIFLTFPEYIQEMIETIKPQ